MAEEAAETTATGGETQVVNPAKGETAKPGDGKGGKDAVLADLAKERDRRQALEEKLDAFQTAQKSQMDALAKALGAKPDENANELDVAQQIAELQKQFTEAQKRASLLESATDKQIPKEYLGLWEAAGESEALQQQVLDLVAAKAAAEGKPAFQSSNGQGQGDGKTPPLKEQIAGAERELVGLKSGTPEHRAAQQKVMALKSAQLFEAHRTTN